MLCNAMHTLRSWTTMLLIPAWFLEAVSAEMSRSSTDLYL